jgi:F0F1-type ATP synthase gamma subunit
VKIQSFRAVGLLLMGLFAELHSVKAITPLIGQILVESETHHDCGEVTELHLFYNRPTSVVVYVPVSQRLLPLDQQWQRQLVERPWPTKTLANYWMILTGHSIVCVRVVLTRNCSMLSPASKR